MKKFVIAVLCVIMSCAEAVADVPVWRILWITLPRLNVNHDGTLYQCDMTEWEINKEHELAYDVEKFIEDAAENKVDVQITLFDSEMEVTSLYEYDDWLCVNEENFPEDVKKELQLAEDKGHPYAFKFACYKLDGENVKINSYAGLGGGRYARARAGWYWDDLFLLDVRVHELLHCFDWFYENLLGYTMPGTHNSEQWGYGGSEEKAQEYYHDTLAGAVWDSENSRYIGISPEMWQFHPGNTHEYSGHTYQFFNIKMSWNDAKEYCEALGGHLVSITTQEEQSMLEKFTRISDKEQYTFWAGGEKTSGAWKWTTGENFSLSNFGESSDSGDIYLQLKAWDKYGEWRTSGESEKGSGFICEWDYMRGDLELKPTITTASLPDTNIKADYSKQLYSAGINPVSWTVTGLPEGISCNVSGEITGKALSVGSYSVTANASNSEGTDTKIFVLKVMNENSYEYNDHTYQFFNIDSFWNEAKEYCEILGGHLVSITSPEEQSALESFIKKTPSNNEDEYSSWQNTYWVGGEKDSGAWKWTTGENFSFNNFRENHVDSGDKYLQLKARYHSSGYWIPEYIEAGTWMAAGKEGRSSGFICEWDEARGNVKSRPIIMDSSLPSTNVILEYSKQLYAGGSLPILWTVSGLPEGFSCNVSGEITGKATTEGDYILTVTASNSEGTDTKQFLLAVGPRQDTELNAINFPDETFREYLRSNFDKDNDGWLDKSEIAAAKNIDIRGTEQVRGNITSLKGIEYLTELESLHCEYNNIMELDLSRNAKLSWLECQHNAIKTLDMSGCPSLWTLICSDNNITSLNISACTKVNYVNCGNNELFELDTSKNAGISVLLCGGNNLASLNLSGNENLTWLACERNGLATLDLSNNAKLTNIYCNDNKLVWLNIDNCAGLLKIHCYNNRILTVNIEGCANRNGAEWVFIHDNDTEIVYAHADMPSEPIIAGLTLPTAITGQSYAFALTATSATPITWTHTGRLPAGLTLSESGLISGTPTKAGKASFTAKTTNEYGSDTARFTLQVFDPVQIITAGLKDATISKNYSVTFKVKGTKPVTWTAEGLPDGLSINAKTGRISGKPSAYGTFSAKITASNGAGSLTKEFKLTVKGIPPKIAGNLARAELNEHYSSGLRLTAGSTPVTWSLGGTLPEGLVFDAETGIISGTPTEFGRFRLSVTASNDGGITRPRTVILNVKGTPPRITTARLPDAEAGKPYSTALTAIGSSPITWTAENLPVGFNLDGDTLKGTPTESGRARITVYAVNPVRTVKRILTLKINPAISSLHDTAKNDYEVENISAHSQRIADLPGNERNGALSPANNYIVVAELPVISCDESGMYDFSVALSDDTVIGAELVYIANSDTPSDDDNIAEFYDDTGAEIFCVPESRKITVSVWLNAGTTYSPSIAARK